MFKRELFNLHKRCLSKQIFKKEMKSEALRLLHCQNHFIHYVIMLSYFDWSPPRQRSKKLLHVSRVRMQKAPLIKTPSQIIQNFFSFQLFQQTPRWGEPRPQKWTAATTASPPRPLQRTTTSRIWLKSVLRPPLTIKIFNEKTFSFERGSATAQKVSRPWP